VRAYLLQTHEMLFDAHWHAFRVFEGVPGRGIYDNMKTAVDKLGIGKKRDVNARFTAMTSHYVFDPEFCNPAAGWGSPWCANGSSTIGERAGREECARCAPSDVAADAGLSGSGCA
jgi:hypothetical protein